MRIRPLGAELFHADGQTDMEKLIVAFRNFADASKNAGERMTTEFKALRLSFFTVYEDFKILGPL